MGKGKYLKILYALKESLLGVQNEKNSYSKTPFDIFKEEIFANGLKEGYDYSKDKTFCRFLNEQKDRFNYGSKEDREQIRLIVNIASSKRYMNYYIAKKPKNHTIK